LGANELTCAVYSRKPLHPDECLPQKLALLATADKNPEANPKTQE